MMNRKPKPGTTSIHLSPAPAAAPASTAASIALGLLCAFASAGPAPAQSIVADAQITGQPAGGLYDYTITLNNSSSSTSPIGTFWYSWVPGANFLPSSPGSLQPPTGWSAAVTHAGPTDGYGIQFTTTTAPLNPGSSLAFQFTTADSPAALAGDSPYYAGTPVGTSYAYGGGPFVGASASFIVQSVPEPASPDLMALGGVLVCQAAGRRRRRA